MLTLRELLVRFLDIFSVPRRSFFEYLSYFTSHEDETNKLREFASKEGQVSRSAHACWFFGSFLS